MRHFHLTSLSLVLFALVMAGCGGTAQLVDPQAVESAKQLKMSPSPVVVATPTPAPSVAPVVNAKLAASLTSFKKSLGMGKATAVVDVSNPSQISLTGTVTVSFINNGAPVGTPETRQVTLSAGARQSFTFTNSTWFLDDAKVEVETSNGGYDPHGQGVY